MEDIWNIRAERPLKDAYWAFMRLRAAFGAKLTQPAIQWWMQGPDELGLNPTEQAILGHVVGAKRLLDIGAGDLRVKTRLQRSGFAGTYETVDVSRDVQHDYNDVASAPGAAFDAVLLLEVIEHIRLEDFDAFMDEVIRVLKPGGRVVISTPNPAFISTIWAESMDHRHPYPANDLAAYLQIRGIGTEEVYRVNWASPHEPPWEKVRREMARVVMRGLLRVDYCRGLLLLGMKAPD
jgi:SAM-dependent methyltransferase